MVKKIAMFSFLENHPGSIIPSQRIARFVAERMKIPVFWDDPRIGEQKLDVLVIVNGAYAFSESLAPLGEAVKNAGRVVWIQNDYTIAPPIADGKATSPFRRAFVERRERGLSHLEFWTTCEKFARASPLSTYVNWNALTWDPYPEEVVKRLRKKASDDLFYYGSFRHVTDSKKPDAYTRNSRLKYFDRFLRTKKVPVTISSPGRGDKPNEKFEARYPHATHLGRARDLRAELARHGAGLYIEDTKSHEEFHSPANRLYEMASAGLPIIFQMESVGMLRRAGIDVSEWAALTEDGMLRLFEQRAEIGREQQRLMRSIDHAGCMIEQFAAARAKLQI